MTLVKRRQLENVQYAMEYSLVALLLVLALAYANGTNDVSKTHALTGALVGGGLVAFGSDGLAWPAITQKIALPLLLSPVLALSMSLLLHPVIRFIAGRWEGSCLCVMPASRALVSVDANGNTRTLFQASALGQPVVAVPSHCDRAGLQGVTVGLDT